MPTWLAFAVTRLLEEHFGRLVDYDFTAAMEADLDGIAAGTEERRRLAGAVLLRRATAVATVRRPEPATAVAVAASRRSSTTWARSTPVTSTPSRCGDGIVVRVGRYGPYLEMPAEVEDGEPQRANMPDDLPPTS